MYKSISARRFNAQLNARVKQLREASGHTQKSLAAALGIDTSTYAKYENRSPMPPYAIMRFSVILREDPFYVLTGERVVSG